MPPSAAQYRKKPRPKYINPLQKAVHSFLKDYIAHTNSQCQATLDVDALTSSIPKRYNIYPPLLLLPAHFFSATPEWTVLKYQLTNLNLQDLYQSILTTFKPQGVTHIALNFPISPITLSGTANETRSPTHLIPLHGNFGPPGSSSLLSNEEEEKDSLTQHLSKADFSSALWVRTVQNGGIIQIWAPLWTMFSRGNIGEKARILGEGSFEGLDGAEGLLGQELSEIAIVDLYVGIGYFAFSYLRRGVGRVLGWEVNAWSVEGLRRGCQANGWGVRVLRVDEGGGVEDEEGRVGEEALEGLAAELRADQGIRMIAFQGDNRWARTIIERVKERVKQGMESKDTTSWLDIRHVNLGLLPSSRLAWENAMDVLDSVRGGWVHVHENVDLREMEQKRDAVVRDFQAHVRGRSRASCSHIEQVKTYAPGVMHCVFDVHIEPNAISPGGMENG